MDAMSDAGPARRPIAAVGVVCFRRDEVLLVRRAKPPLEDRWSLPGGRIEWGERARDAALRELKEETGCDAEILGLVDVVDAVLTRTGADAEDAWGHFVLIDYAARWVAGDPIAGDDAREARFFSPAELPALGLWEETLRVIAAARAL
jgi:8-oxo-dGTP diphosphatase